MGERRERGNTHRSRHYHQSYHTGFSRQLQRDDQVLSFDPRDWYIPVDSSHGHREWEHMPLPYYSFNHPFVDDTFHRYSNRRTRAAGFAFDQDMEDEFAPPLPGAHRSLNRYAPCSLHMGEGLEGLTGVIPTEEDFLDEIPAPFQENDDSESSTPRDDKNFGKERQGGQESNVNSRNSFHKCDDGPELSNNPIPLAETVQILHEGLQELKRESQKLRLERLEFQRLTSGIEDALESLINDRDRRYGDFRSGAQRSGYQGSYSYRHFHREARHRDTHEGSAQQRTRPATEIPSNATDQGKSLDKYNSAWLVVLGASHTVNNGNPSIPWPSENLSADMLSRTGITPRTRASRGRYSSVDNLPQEIEDSSFQLRKWNTFKFFVHSFGMRAKYTVDGWEDGNEGMNDDRTGLVFSIQTTGASKTQLEALKKQLNQEKLRWHPDKLKRRFPNICQEDEEVARAVWDGIIAISEAHAKCLKPIH